jgi:hypothetical protein
MKRFLFLLLPLALVACVSRKPAMNPDPNHTHADFAVYIDGAKIDFSDPTYMSNETKHRHKYFHLHDEIGTLVHRHKPNLTLGEFFDSLGVKMAPPCMVLDSGKSVCDEGDKRWTMVVNAKDVPFDPQYVFQDTDKILLTYGILVPQIMKMTDDACLYSRTCPERGKARTENCIADPTVPCTAL